jgi:hypothetical protein
VMRFSREANLRLLPWLGMREYFQFPFPHLSSWNGVYHPGTASGRSEDSSHTRGILQISWHVRFSYRECC